VNRDSYNRIALQWSQARSHLSAIERAYLDELLRAAPMGGTVLDLGCGSGCPMAQYVVSCGRHVIGIDQSEALLNLAKKRLPNERWMLARMQDYRLEEDYCAAIVWDSLFHVTRAGHEPILRKVVAGLPANGRLVLTVGGAEHPAFTDFMFGERFFYDSNAPAQTEQILRALGCRIARGELIDVPDGKRDKGRYAIVAEKSA
jgi:cyclopropane fatty-acyl-phospholipid synthase-like methyltransferase